MHGVSVVDTLRIQAGLALQMIKGLRMTSRYSVRGGTALIGSLLKRVRSGTARASSRPMFESERLLLTLMSNLDGMVYRCRNDEHWTMEFVSEGCLAVTGYTPQELQFNSRLSYENLTYHEDRQRIRTEIAAALKQGRRYELEYRICHADGSVRWVWERGSGVGRGDSIHLLEGIIQDITGRRQAEQQLRETERRYRSIFENALEGMFQSTPEEGYLTVNPSLARLYGYSSPQQLIDELKDIDHNLYVEPGRRAEFMQLIAEHGVASNFESQVRRRDGSLIWISENAYAVRDETGALLFFEGTVEDITERRRREGEIRHQATHDILTGLPNRVLLEEALLRSLKQNVGDGEHGAVIFLDIDHFKLVNDSLGHAGGDELLKLVAQRLRATLRDDDVVARLGGDEFVVVLVRDVDEAQVQMIVQRILSAIGRPCTVAGQELSVRCSIGIALYPAHGHDIDSLLRNADAAMYRAKELGRNNAQLFHPQLHSRTAFRLENLTRLQHALERREFVLQYQPKFDLATRGIVGVEALIRWHSPDQGWVSPADFIPLAEESGLIVPIGAWVLHEACAQIRRWQDEGLPPVPVAVNLSPRQLMDDSLVHQVRSELSFSGVDARLLDLEITETAVAVDVTRSVAVLNSLRELGVGIAMDDFGTGYSSLGHLKRFPVTSLKIDKSFVSELPQDPDAVAIIRAIISLGHILALTVVAEGVETAEQLAFLRDNGCDQIQGYHLSRPLDAAAFAARYRAQLDATER